MHSAICLTVPCKLYSQSTGMGKYHGNRGSLNKWMRYGAEKKYLRLSKFFRSDWHSRPSGLV